jgi:HEAT repeat protein
LLAGLQAEKWSDRASAYLCILAHAPLDPDSKLAAKLAMTGGLVIPCLMQMSESSSSAHRCQAVALLVQLRAKTDELSLKTAQKISQVTVSALHDRDEMVRVGTVHALGNFGGEDVVPALEEVAKSDSADEVQGQSIRKLAAKAIAAIQKRAQEGPAQ